MRIVAGAWRGRVLKAPAGTDTRPTSDRVREATFDMLAARLGSDLGGEGAVTLDLFAGSGALGLEALSRGVRSAVFVEQDRRALATLRGNIETLGADARARVLAGDVFRVANANALPAGPFSLLLADPPYRIDAARVSGLFALLAERGAIVPGAIAVYEHDPRPPATWPEGFTPIASRTYGSTAVSLARWDEGGDDR